MTKSAEELCKIIKEHYCSGQTRRVARLLMSIHNGRTSVSFFNDLQGFDYRIKELVNAVISEFFTGAYRDGDFNTLACWLIDDMGYMDDVMIQERKDWITANEPQLLRKYNDMPASIRDHRFEDHIPFEEFAQARWAKNGKLLEAQRSL